MKIFQHYIAITPGLWLLLCLIAGGCTKKWDGDMGIQLIYSKRSVAFDPATGNVIQNITHNLENRIGYSHDMERKTITFYRSDQENFEFNYLEVIRDKQMVICDSLRPYVAFVLNSNKSLCVASKNGFGRFYFMLEDGKLTEEFNCYEYVFF
jgi:hypothetical protein